MNLPEKISSKFKKLHSSYFCKDCKYDLIKDIDEPQKSLKKISNDDDHYTLYLTFNSNKYANEIIDIENDIVNKLKLYLSKEEKIKLLNNTYTKSGEILVNNNLYKPKLSITNQFNFNKNIDELLRSLKYYFQVADSNVSRNYFMGKVNNGVDPSKICNLTVIFGDFEWYHRKNLLVFEEFLFEFIKLKIADYHLKKFEDRKYLIYFNDYLGVKILENFREYFDDKIGPAVLVALKELFEKKYYSGKPLGRKKTPTNKYLKVVNSILGTEIESLKSIKPSNNPEVKRIFKISVDYSKSDF